MSREPAETAAVAAARAHLGPDPRRPLAPLPDGFAQGRDAVHRVAEETLQEIGRAETGSGALSPFTPGGVGTPRWESGLASGEPGIARIERTELVIERGPEEERSELGLDPAVTSALCDFYALVTVALAELIGTDAGAETIRLWPEHFDAATVLGDEERGTRANYGGSPGDALHPEPYLYVGPFATPDADPFWNATGFSGAELGYTDLLGAADQPARAAGFFRRGRELLG